MGELKITKQSRSLDDRLVIIKLTTNYTRVNLKGGTE